tara:strand:+ start:6413 stop:6871 length:459 start_codon:yes stop_codon:yes gene_type:complete
MSGETNIEHRQNVSECPICMKVISKDRYKIHSINNIYQMKCCKNTLCFKCYSNWHIVQRNNTCVFCRTNYELDGAETHDEFNDLVIEEVIIPELVPLNGYIISDPVGLRQNRNSRFRRRTGRKGSPVCACILGSIFFYIIATCVIYFNSKQN